MVEKGAKLKNGYMGVAVGDLTVLFAIVIT